jgi:PadR family transcriptional regulator PadR
MVLGNFELMVLLAVIRIGDNAYGVSIAKEIDAASGQETILAGVYAALQRLEAKGLLSSKLGDVTPERGGRPRRYFRATAQGVRIAHQTQNTLERLWLRFSPVNT